MHANFASEGTLFSPPPPFGPIETKDIDDEKSFETFLFSLVSGPLSEVQTATGLEVTLPCDLFPHSMSPSTLSQDKVTLVIWYKEGNQKPIYS